MPAKRKAMSTATAASAEAPAASASPSANGNGDANGSAAATPAADTKKEAEVKHLNEKKVRKTESIVAGGASAASASSASGASAASASASSASASTTVGGGGTAFVLGDTNSCGYVVPPPGKNRATGAPIPEGWRWHGTLLYYADPASKPSSKLAGFDFDDCLAKTSLFKKGADAWSLKFPSVPQKLRELHAQGYHIFIFTNQSDIGKAAKDESRAKAIAEKTGRLRAFVKSLGSGDAAIPIDILVATAKPGGEAKPKAKKGKGKKGKSAAAAEEDDEGEGAGADGRGDDASEQYRKPLTGMWMFAISKLNGDGMLVDKSKSFFVGDAAGRKKDHSDSDKQFAARLALKFYTEDEYFG